MTDTMPFPPMPPTGETMMPGFMPTPPQPDPIAVHDLMTELIARVEEEAERQTKPRYPAWFDQKDWPKPDVDEALTECRRLHAEFGPLRQRFADDIEFLRGNRAGHFSDASEKEKESLYHDSTPQAEVELLVAQLGAIPPTYKPDARFRTEEDEAADKADFLYACDDEAERRHLAAGNGPYRTDVVRTELIYGRLVAQIMYNLDCEPGEIPIRENLIDPATCCPVFEQDRGLAKMVRVYRTTVGDALASFNCDGKLRRKIKEGRDFDGRFGKKRADHEACEIIEYWDRWWKIVWMDSECIIGPIEHKLGEPPYVYQPGALGLPGYIRNVNSGYNLNGMSYEPFSVTRDTAMPEKGVSHVHLLRYPIWLRESIMARVIYHFRRSIDPAYLVSQDYIAEKKGAPEIDNAPNAMNTIFKDHEDLQALPSSPQAESFGPIMQQNADSLGRLLMPAAAYGINSNSNVSGFAVESLGESGRDKMLPHLVTLESFYQQLAEKRLRLYANWGWLLKQGDEDRGTLYVPRSRPLPYQDPQFTLTFGDIRRTGTRCKVKMTGLRLQSLGQIANAIAILRNMGIQTRRAALELLGDPNPERTLQELMWEELENDPDYRTAKLIKSLEERGDSAAAEYVKQRKEKQSAQQTPPALPAGMGAPSSPVGIQGASLPGFGMPPGAGTGPQGPLGPRTE